MKQMIELLFAISVLIIVGGVMVFFLTIAILAGLAGVG